MLKKISPLIITALLLIFYLASNWSTLTTLCHETGDYAANALKVERALVFDELLGPYSRLRFSHPGPLIFYWRAAFEYLIPASLSPHAIHVLSQIILNFISISLILYILNRFFNWTYACLLLLILGSHIYTIDPYIWSDTWGPASVVFPTLLFILSSSAVNQGHILYLYLSIISGSLIVQTHLSTALPIFLIIFLALYNLYKYYVKNKISLPYLHILSASFLALILWLPPIIDIVLEWGKSNLALILDYFMRTKSAHSIFETLTFIASAYVPFSSHITGEYLIVVFILLISTFLFTSINKLPLIKFFKISTIIIILTSIFSLRKAVGDLHPYLIYFHIGVASFIYAFLLFKVLDYLKSRLNIPAKLYDIVFILVSLAIIPFILNSPGNSLCNNEPEELAKQIKPQTKYLYLIEFAPNKRKPAWSSAVGFALWLKRNNFSYCVPKKWGFLFGKDPVCKKDIDYNKAKIKLIFYPRRGKNLPEVKEGYLIKSAQAYVVIEEAH